MSLGSLVQQAWYEGARWLMVLRPLETLYRRVASIRRARYEAHPERRYRAPVPVIVVGNLSVGGTGKSPMVAWLVSHLRDQGWSPGILSRGYGGTSKAYPLQVDAHSDPAIVGDEPVMLASQTGVPVAVAPQRKEAARLLATLGCDILVSDDGLQHYALERDIELVVVDGARGFGNGHCLPAGPLREPLSRLESVDAVIVNGNGNDNLPIAGAYSARLLPRDFRRLSDDKCFALSPIPFCTPVHALAGIGNPQRFFATLEAIGVEAECHAFEDHHAFTSADLEFFPFRPKVMTAKDAIKCRGFADDSYWALDVVLEPQSAFIAWIDSMLMDLKPGKR